MAKKKTIRTIPQARTPMPEQSPEVRVKNFDEVACGYRLEDALVEADRCLDCADEPCVKGCPVGIDIPGFIRKMAAKNFHGAYDTITDTNLLPSVCGRVCPQESQCEGVCTVGETLEPVAIGRLERFVGDMAIREGWANVPYIQPSRFKVGIVGSGPAGMACAADMAKAGCEVTVYEAFQEPGGVLKYGIPDFRLPNSVVDVEIEKLTRLGIRFECNTLVGRLFTLEQMLTEMGFHAVFVGTGAGYPSFMGIPGESLNGVLSANEWLTRCNLMHGRDFPSYDTPLQPGKRVAVVGAGN
ncbi:MAG TPA: FAD-dependent oxidoreductase, partial [Caldimonas sp.]